MPGSKYIKVLIADQEVEIEDPENLLGISYKIEDTVNFQTKESSKVFGLTVPYTNQNSKITNTIVNPGVEDMTDDEKYKNPQKIQIIGNGHEIFTGKAFLVGGKHTDRPTKAEFDAYGNNGDWLIPLKDTTLHDFVKDIIIPFSKQKIIDSWDYDGTDANLPYCFIPIRYGQMMDKGISLVDGVTEIEDYNMKPTYMKPSLSKYWIIYKALKSVGYKISSEFFDSPYFRKQLMPWTWGGFLDSDGTKMDILRFLAKSASTFALNNADRDDFVDCFVTNDSINGAFDNNDTYQYVNSIEMKWTYKGAPSPTFGPLDATFHLNLFIDAEAHSSLLTAGGVAAFNKNKVKIRAYWYKNGFEQTVTTHVDIKSPFIGTTYAIGSFEEYQTFSVVPGDIISVKIHLEQQHKGLFGHAKSSIFVDAFETAYFRIPLGGTVSFENMLAFKNYKFLDYLAGIVDEFNLSFQTDPVNKIVYFEPTHPYSVTNDLSVVSGGYFNGKMLDWTDKHDLSKESEPINFSEGDRELLFQFRDDQNDGTLKKTQDRSNIRLGQAKYVLPERFKSGQKTMENRFFAPTMHYEPPQWGFPGFGTPQMIIMQPENISNTSRSEAQNTLLPKSIYYKGKITSVKWVFDGENSHPYPFGFAVNYQVGGENDPVLSYVDENVGPETAPTIAKGLLRRFYLQRLQIMRTGKHYRTWFKLNNNDIANFLHREHIILYGQKWELVEIVNYNPLKEDSTECYLRKHYPIESA